MFWKQYFFLIYRVGYSAEKSPVCEKKNLKRTPRLYIGSDPPACIGFRHHICILFFYQVFESWQIHYLPEKKKFLKAIVWNNFEFLKYYPTKKSTFWLGLPSTTWGGWWWTTSWTRCWVRWEDPATMITWSR